VLKIPRALFPFLWLWIALSILRLAFVYQNASFFEHLSFSTFIYGAFFDAVTIALLSLPYAILSFPHPWKQNKLRIWISNAYLLLIAVFILVLNTWDIAYFSYTQKRSSFSYFMNLLTGSEIGSLAGEFLVEFWWLPFIFGALLFVFIRLLQKQIKDRSQLTKTTIKAWISYVLLLAFTFSLARGGFSLRPISIIDATAMTNLEQAPVVLNTAFTVLKTSRYNDPKKVQYFSDHKLKKVLPSTESIAHSLLPKNTNIVVVMLESFGTIYAGPNSKESYTPFLDSLLKESLFLENAVANGRTSMDAVPAILAGMPSWQNESYILSPFCTNQIDALPSFLKQKGYHTSFFHGAKTGSMNFDDFTKAIGVEHYYGLEQYKGPAAFDGNWGIWDHAMLSYFADELSSFKAPFLSTIFTLSSHHPYTLPPTFKKRVENGPEQLCATISYTDQALKGFFKKAQSKKWFKNTLFVFVADHVGPTRRASNQSIPDRYHIPIGFYHPSIKLQQYYANKYKPSEVFQQIDIFPTILDMLGYHNQAFCFGQSLFAKEQGAKMVYENGSLVLFKNDKKALDIYSFTPYLKRSISKKERIFIDELMASYQNYQHRLIENRCRKGR
jgi:phosphoglycerol transferase MdoB-like AlkP superfamily enzyme